MDQGEQRRDTRSRQCANGTSNGRSTPPATAATAATAATTRHVDAAANTISDADASGTATAGSPAVPGSMFYVFTAEKAGMSNVDKSHINKVVYDMSKVSTVTTHTSTRHKR